MKYEQEGPDVWEEENQNWQNYKCSQLNELVLNGSGNSP